MKILCVLEVEPIAKPRMTRRDKWARRPCVLRYWDFCDQLRAAAVKAQYNPSNELSLVFVLPMPSSWSARKKKGMLGKPHQQKPDLDNLVKAFKDAMLKEDKTVHRYNFMQKIWGETGKIVVMQPNPSTDPFEEMRDAILKA